MTELTPGQRAVLAAYGRGTSITQIAQQTGRTQERVGVALLALCQLNRQHARHLAQTGGPAQLTPVPDDTHTDPEGIGCPSTGTHSSLWAYKKFGCRCPDAVKKNAAAVQRNHANRRARAAKPKVWARNADETTQTVRELTALGLSSTAIGQRLGMNPRTVQRYRNPRASAARVAVDPAVAEQKEGVAA